MNLGTAKHSARPTSWSVLLQLIAAGLACDLALSKAGVAQPNNSRELWELRILHTSDQEAGKKALIDIPGMVAVMDQLDRLPFANTIKLTSGDLFIAGPFMNASQVLYSNSKQYGNLKPHQRSLEPLAMRPGIADLIINNNLGWQAAAIGNHEFDGISLSKGILNQNNFFRLIAADRDLINYDGRGIGNDALAYKQPGAGISSTSGYRGAEFPYLSVNIDFNSFKANPQGQSIFEAYGLKDRTSKPSAATANSLGRSTIIHVGNSKVGVIGATTPFLPDIVGSLEPSNMLAGSYRSKETSAAEQAAALKPLIKREVEALEKQGINKIVLLTHLQDSAIEQELSQQLVNDQIGVDVVIGGGSHKVMAPGDAAQKGMLRGLDQSSVIDATAKARQQVVAALIPYPQQLSAANKQRIYYVNGGANYEYLNQLVVRFNTSGQIVDHDPINSRPWKTDEKGVIAMLGKSEWLNKRPREQHRLIKDHILRTSKNSNYRNAILTVNAVESYINSLDSIQYGRSTQWLNGNNGDVRSRETNLGNLIADAMLWYGQELSNNNPKLKSVGSIDIAFVTGGSIRDMIGTEQVMPDETVHRDPPEANPLLDKQAGEVSKLDVMNCLRFDNSLTMGRISIEQLKRSLEAMVAERQHGGFGQVSGLRFRYDPKQAKGQRVIEITLTRPYRLADGRVDGRRQDQQPIRPLLRDGKPVNPGETIGMITLAFLAEGADGQGGAQLTQHLQNAHWVGRAGNAAAWQQAGQPVPTVIPEQDAPSSIRAGLSERQLLFGSDRDALAAYLTVQHGAGSPSNPFAVADLGPNGQPNRARIMPLSQP